MRALVVHPRWSIAGGGEFVCLNIIQALGEAGYQVSLMSSDYDRERARTAFGFDGNLDEVVDTVPLKNFRAILPRFLALQRTLFASSERRRISEVYREYDMIWHTQTAYFLGPPENRTFNVFYDPSDIFLIQNIRKKSVQSIEGPLAKTYKRPYYWFLRHFSGNEGDVKQAFNIPLSQALEQFLEECGYRHSPYLFPPCDMSFKPRPKIKRVVQVTRVVPHKRLEDFVEIARRLPKYEFLIVGSISKTERSLHHGYFGRVFRDLPKNVKYVEARIHDVPHLLEESAVYLYTSTEPGINISTAQAIGAGCIPITPDVGGGMEIVSHTGGYVYRDLREAVHFVESAMEDWNLEIAPHELSKNAQIFSAENFRDNVKKLVRGN